MEELSPGISTTSRRAAIFGEASIVDLFDERESKTMKSGAATLILVAVILASYPTAGATAPDFKLFDLSLPHFALNRGERVVGYECAVRGGSILRINPPDLWDLTLENGPAASAKLSAYIIEGAAAFEPSNLRYFEDFLTVGTLQDAAAAGLDSYFDVKVVVLAAPEGDEEHARKLTFTLKQLKLSPRLSLK